MPAMILCSCHPDLVGDEVEESYRLRGIRKERGNSWSVFVFSGCYNRNIKLGEFKVRSLFSHHFRGQNFSIKVLSALVSGKASIPGCHLGNQGRLLFLSCYFLTPSLL